VSDLSEAEKFRLLEPEIKQRRIAKLTDEEVLALKYDWHFHGRPLQFAPQTEVPWVYWLILAGRGFGKTRTGAEWCREQVKTCQHVNIVGATVTDARDIMIEGESGILACCSKRERPLFVASKRQLQWPNGAKSLIFTADEPERLRGKQHEKLWADELAAWRYPEAWDQAMFGLRLGKHPQACITTTPRPIQIVRDLIKDPASVVTRGSTYDNRTNLAAAFFNKIITKYEGSRLGRQELNAELLEDNPGALWKLSDIDRLRVNETPMLARVVTAIDPSVKEDGSEDEAGIVVAGLGYDGEVYVLDDISLAASPHGWATHAVNLGYKRHCCDRIVAEVNNGGALVESVIRTVDPDVPYEAVHASRGKRTRAEPVSALYEQGRVHHVGTFAKLEDEMCQWDPEISPNSPNRVDALVWAVTQLMGGLKKFCFGSIG
jgi:predicted phage terminase large subunit-like protein